MLLLHMITISLETKAEANPKDFNAKLVKKLGHTVDVCYFWLIPSHIIIPTTQIPMSNLAQYLGYGVS